MSVVSPADPGLIVLGYDPLYFALAFYLSIAALVVLDEFLTRRSK